MSGTPGTPFELRNRGRGGAGPARDPEVPVAPDAAEVAEAAEVADAAEVEVAPVAEPADTPVVEAVETAEAEVAETPVVDTVDDSAVEPVETAGSPSGRQVRWGVEGWVWALLVVSVLALVLGVLQWRSVSQDPDRARAALRDQAVVQGTRAIETLQTLDYRKIDAGLERWQDVSTGVLHDQFVAISESQRDAIAQAEKVTTARVVSAGLTDLDTTTATMIASTEVTVGTTDPTEEPTVKRNRYAAELTLVDGVWKVENIQQVAVNL